MRALPDIADMGSLSRFISDLDLARSSNDAVDVLHAFMLEIGISRFVYGWTHTPLRADGTWVSVPLITRNFPDNWDHNWSRHSNHDPYLRASFLTCKDVNWIEVQATRERLSVYERDCIDYVADWGLIQGLTLPMQRPGRFAFVTAIGPVQDGTTWTTWVTATSPLLKLVAHYFDDLMARQYRGTGSFYEKLSVRELECLTWSARGKTVDVISQILGISPETVRIYLKRSNQKLNAINRINAVARAVTLGLIDIE